MGCWRTGLERDGLCFGRENDGIFSTRAVRSLTPHKHEASSRPHRGTPAVANAFEFLGGRLAKVMGDGNGRRATRFAESENSSSIRSSPPGVAQFEDVFSHCKSSLRFTSPS